MQQSTPSLRQRAINAALGQEPFDLLLTNGRLIDMVTGEIRDADIGIVGELIASVHPRKQFMQANETRDLHNHYLCPGLIDMHVHLESSHLTPEHYAQVVVPQGTTTVFWDPHELANILGLSGVRYAIDSTRHLPLRVLCAAPSCVPSTPGLERSGAEFTAQDIATMLSWPEIAGLAEVMDMHGVLTNSEKMNAILAAGLNSHKLIEGHGRGLQNERLQAYLAAGVTSDHELTSAEDLINKLRAGLTIQIRGSHPYLLEEFVKKLKTLPYLSPQITLCTDDVPSDLLVEKGGILPLVKTLVQYGLPVIDALRMATFNAATRLQRHDLGLIASGRVADLIIFDNLDNLSPLAVYTQGKLQAEHNQLVTPITPYPLPSSICNTMHLPLTQRSNFLVKIPGVKHGQAQLRIIKSARFTQWREISVQVIDGIAQLPKGYSLIYVQHRHGQHAAPPQLSIMEDWGQFQGAIATTYSHDSHNLVILGADPDDMQLAANTLIQSGGGMVLTKQGKILKHIAMPIAGILSEAPPKQLAEDFKQLRALSDLVAEWLPPYRVFKAIEGTCLACNAGPHLTDLGLTDGTTRQIVNPLISVREMV